MKASVLIGGCVLIVLLGFPALRGACRQLLQFLDADDTEDQYLLPYPSRGEPKNPEEALWG